MGRDHHPAGPVQRLGSFAAVYFLVTGIDGRSLFGIQVFVQDLFYGAALIVAVCVSVLARRRAQSS